MGEEFGLIFAYLMIYQDHEAIAKTVISYFFFFGLFAISWTIPTAYGGSQARGLMGAVTSSQSHSSVVSELRLQPTPQLTATPDP